ncbi:MAG: [SSU ribosomal protein S18P]-alanine acetyltransferase [Clostridia bacterium 41_269]|nr:MAG: [SSU ribosomal protein S18P]-alanine acetyltransferase [Clostridia bacterium 41_269]
MDSLTIQPMMPEHLDEVLKIEEVSFPSPWSKQAYLNELLFNDFAHYFVCTLKGCVIGYIGMWIVIDEGHITTIAVAPEYRGKRIAEKMLKFAADYAGKFGAEKLVLEVRVSNLSAQKLYRRMGFKNIGVRKEYYSDSREDAIVMFKPIGKDNNDYF